MPFWYIADAGREDGCSIETELRIISSLKVDGSRQIYTFGSRAVSCSMYAYLKRPQTIYTNASGHGYWLDILDKIG